jgi:hypothetical protein
MSYSLVIHDEQRAGLCVQHLNRVLKYSVEQRIQFFGSPLYKSSNYVCCSACVTNTHLFIRLTRLCEGRSREQAQQTASYHADHCPSSSSEARSTQSPLLVGKVRWLNTNAARYRLESTTRAYSCDVAARCVKGETCCVTNEGMHACAHMYTCHVSLISQERSMLGQRL